MLPQEAIENNKRRATCHFIVAIDDMAVVESSATGVLDACRVTGRVETVYRKPWFCFGRAPRRGKPFSVTVPCWNETRQPEPPGTKRLHYGGTTLPRRIEVWGSIVEKAFAAFEFEEID